MKILTCLLSLSVATAATADTGSLREALNAALYTENVTCDAESAAEHYADLVAAFEAEGSPTDQRVHAATALFRLAEIRDRQNREEEARTHYQAYLERFPDLEPQAGFAREKLGTAKPGPRQTLTQVGGNEADSQLAEDVYRARWNFRSKLRPDELLLTTFQVKHQEGYANEGLPPAFEVRTLHYQPSGNHSNWFSHTQVNWPEEIRRERSMTEVTLDRHNHVSGFGQTYVVPEGLTYGGRGSGDTAMALFFTNRRLVRDQSTGAGYRDEAATKWLTVKLSSQIVSLKRARTLLDPLQLEIPKMGSEAWSLTLPASPAELANNNTVK